MARLIGVLCSLVCLVVFGSAQVRDSLRWLDQTSHQPALTSCGSGSLPDIFCVAQFSPPNITSISPASALAGTGPLQITVSGSNFTSSSVVRCNNANRVTNFVNPGMVLGTLTLADLATPGFNQISVANPPPSGASNNFSFAVNHPVPTLSSISPNSAGVYAGQTTLTVTGSNFNSSSVVRWNGADRATTFVNSTTLTASILNEINPGGVYSISVFNPTPGGGTSNTLNFTLNNPVPVINGLTPSSGFAGAPHGFQMTVLGSDFTPNSVIRWNGADRPTTFISPTQIRMVVATSDLATIGSVPVTVFNPGPGGGLTGAVNFDINPPTPEITALSPSTLPAGGGAASLIITGNNFYPTSVGRFNGSDRTTTYSNSGQISIILTASDLLNGGSYPITVHTPGPTSATSSPMMLTVTNPSPTISSLSPTSVPAGSQSFVLTVTGTGFNETSQIQWNGNLRVTTYVNPTTVTTTIFGSDIQVPGTATVQVLNPAPGGGVSSTVGFTITNGLPSISFLAPSSLNASTPGFTVDIIGSGFSPTSIARINGSGRTTTYFNSGRVTIQLNFGDLAFGGIYPITVFNPGVGGGTSNAVNLTVNNLIPVVGSITPNTVTVGGPTFTLNVFGSNFVPNSKIVIDGQFRVTSFLWTGQLAATVLASEIATIGTKTIQVSNPTPGGGFSTTSATLTIVPRIFAGNVNLVGYQDPTDVPITLRFRPVGGAPGSEVLTTTVNLSPTGGFSIGTELPPGFYDIYADGSIWLQKRLDNVNANGAFVLGLNWDLLAGDIDGDGAITPSDYGIWAVNNGSFVNPGENGDLDGDGAVTPSDYGIWAENNGLLDDD